MNWPTALAATACYACAAALAGGAVYLVIAGHEWFALLLFMMAAGVNFKADKTEIR